MTFRRNIILETERLIVRNWIEADRDLMHEIHSDPKVLEYFTHGHSRAESDALLDCFRKTIDQTGFGLYALERKEDGRPIGFCGLTDAETYWGNIVPSGRLKDAQLQPVAADVTIEIAWRLALEFWGKGYITEAALALLDYGFKTKSLPAIVAIAVGANSRSIAVMERIGLELDPARCFDHPTIPQGHANLVAHVLYALTREQWLARQGKASPRP